MGWQDRDWAKFDDAELQQLFGVTTTGAAGMHTRLWSIVLLLLLAVGGFAYTQMPHRAPAPAPPSGADVLYGVRGTDSSVGPLMPGGVETVCTQEQFVGATQSWACVAWELNDHDLPVVAPAQYRGPCTHLVAARDQAIWTCLGNDPVAPAQPVPSGSSG